MGRKPNYAAELRRRKAQLKEILSESAIEIPEEERAKKGGRPKLTSKAVIAREKLIAASDPVVDELIAIALTHGHPKQEQAIEYCLDRVYGKAAQPIVGEEDKGIHIVIDGLEDFAK